MIQRVKNWVGERARPLFWRTLISGLVLGAGSWGVYEIQRAVTTKKTPTKVVKKKKVAPTAETATVSDTDAPIQPPTMLPEGRWKSASEVAQVANNDESPAPRRALLAPPSRSFVPQGVDTPAEATQPATNPYRGGSRYQGSEAPAPVETAPEAATESVSPGDAAEAYSRRFQTPAPTEEQPVEVPATNRRGGARFQPPVEETPAEPQPAALLPTTTPRTLPRGALSGSPNGPQSTAAEGEGVPGDKQTDGAQNPSLIIEKAAPSEIQVGKPATFEVRVKNVGKTPAQQVTITDQVPRGTKFVEARPECQRGGDGVLTWQIETLRPGEEKVLTVQLMPISEGEIGSVAQVSFLAHAGARTICTRPVLQVEHTAPKRVLIGETVRLGITLTNTGSGAASGVSIEEDVPEGLSHAAGRELEYEVGTLKPGESKQLELVLVAEKPGLIENVVIARGEGNLVTEHRSQIEVIAPQLQVGVSGPKRRYLDRQATYAVSVANPGTASAREVELIAFLPKGMKFVAADAEGQYDSRQHAVFWSLEELPPSKAGSVKLTTVPTEPGEQRLRVEGKADLGLAANGEQTVQVDTAAELFFSITNLSNPIEVGSDTTYEIKVANNGSKAATNVRIAASLPVELRATGAEGPSRHSGDEQKIVFEPLARLNPREEAVFRINAQGVRAGDTRVRVQLTSDEEPSPVTKEESTRVYADR